MNFLHLIFFTDHWCTPADHIKPETLNISLEDWKQKFLPIELGPDYQPRASQCSMFEVTENEIPKFLSGEFPGNQSENLKKVTYLALATDYIVHLETHLIVLLH